VASRILAGCHALSDVASDPGVTAEDGMRWVHASGGSALDPSVVGALWRELRARPAGSRRAA
jgi:hypothetical protein